MASRLAKMWLWLFWVAPLVGAILGGIAYPIIVGPDVAPQPEVTGTRR